MILTTKETDTNCTAKTSSFKINASPLAFEILSSKLYSDPMLAVIRELTSNAWDAEIEAGNTLPVEVHVPSRSELWFSIRDHGNGLSDDEVKTLYTTFFSSTKSTTNDYTGAFGLGSKSPFAVSNTFTINSRQNGIKHSYLAVKKDGYPSIIDIGTTEAPDEYDGLEIIVPTLEDTTSSWLNRIQNYYKYLNINYTITNHQAQFHGDIWRSIDNMYIYKNKDTYETAVVIRQGTNVYTLPYETINKYNLFDTYWNDSPRTPGSTEYIRYLLRFIVKYNTILIDVPIGTYTMTPNREQLSVESLDKLGDDLLIYLNKLISWFTKYTLSNIDYESAYNLDIVSYIINCHKFNTDVEVPVLTTYIDIYHIKCIDFNHNDIAVISDIHIPKDTHTKDTEYYYNPNKVRNVLGYSYNKEEIIAVSNKKCRWVFYNRLDKKKISKLNKLKNIVSHMDTTDLIFTIGIDLAGTDEYRAFKQLATYISDITPLNIQIDTININKFIRDNASLIVKVKRKRSVKPQYDVNCRATIAYINYKNDTYGDSKGNHNRVLMDSSVSTTLYRADGNSVRCTNKNTLVVKEISLDQIRTLNIFHKFEGNTKDGCSYLVKYLHNTYGLINDMDAEDYGSIHIINLHNKAKYGLLKRLGYTIIDNLDKDLYELATNHSYRLIDPDHDFRYLYAKIGGSCNTIYGNIISLPEIMKKLNNLSEHKRMLLSTTSRYHLYKHIVKIFNNSLVIETYYSGASGCSFYRDYYNENEKLPEHMKHTLKNSKYFLGNAVFTYLNEYEYEIIKELRVLAHTDTTGCINNTEFRNILLLFNKEHMLC